MPRNSQKHLHGKVEAEYRMSNGENVFKIKSDDPGGLHVALYKLFRKRNKDVSLNKDEDGVWIRKRT